MNDNENKEKQSKAGNPIFIIIIFVALLGFVFIVPEVYKKFNPVISDFLGVGKEEKDEKPKEEYKDAVSSYFEIGSTGSLKYNEIVVSDVKLSSDKKLSFKVSSEKKLDLEELNYYVEFYQNKTVFKGRRILKGIADKDLNVELDLSNLEVNNGSYFTISHIDAIPPYESDTDESGLSSIFCKKGDYTYEYEFNLKKLQKVKRKYSYSSADMDEFASKLLDAEKSDKKYNELTGVSSSVVKDNYTFLHIVEFDYNVVSSFRVEDEHLFAKDTLNNIVRFKMDAEGFDCE